MSLALYCPKNVNQYCYFSILKYFSCCNVLTPISKRTYCLRGNYWEASFKTRMKYNRGVHRVCKMRVNTEWEKVGYSGQASQISVLVWVLKPLHHPTPARHWNTLKSTGKKCLKVIRKCYLWYPSNYLVINDVYNYEVIYYRVASKYHRCNNNIYSITAVTYYFRSITLISGYISI